MKLLFQICHNKNRQHSLAIHNKRDLSQSNTSIKETRLNNEFNHIVIDTIKYLYNQFEKDDIGYGTDFI